MSLIKKVRFDYSGLLLIVAIFVDLFGYTFVDSMGFFILL